MLNVTLSAPGQLEKSLPITVSALPLCEIMRLDRQTVVRDSEGQLLTMLKGDSQKECTADILTSTQDVFEICPEFHCAKVDAKLCNQQ
ncbi:hypothetical protein M404DRAFT_1000568 [Pisolithus tinctorius Marx 270]|uniref:Uncharacterized protein n=1 Tax=Pisolithus tinctorius Marx 270 TaxID=870435 RepID=A0A0C3NUA2_PISTI|nr:hypothetical protein M404DRAFT_1000568 [Pisolithus tinctorius Marx 270]